MFDGDESCKRFRESQFLFLIAIPIGGTRHCNLTKRAMRMVAPASRRRFSNFPASQKRRTDAGAAKIRVIHAAES
jgi:hypothetical protein